jgi:host factor-I protein
MHDNEELPALQHPFLNALRKERRSVAIFLHNGTRLDGVIQAFDQYAILLSGIATQIVYKHTIASVVPDAMRAVAKPPQATAQEGAENARREAAERTLEPDRRTEPKPAVSVTYRTRRLGSLGVPVIQSFDPSSCARLSKATQPS